MIPSRRRKKKGKMRAKSSAVNHLPTPYSLKKRERSVFRQHLPVLTLRPVPLKLKPLTPFFYILLPEKLRI
jgi:hypothetical protein